MDDFNFLKTENHARGHESLRYLDIRDAGYLLSAKPCIIALSAAFKYDDPRYLAHSARAFGKILGLTDDLATTAKLADLIHESLTDLLKIPPMPTTEKVVGEVEVQTADGRRTSFDMIVHDPGHA